MNRPSSQSRCRARYSLVALGDFISVEARLESADSLAKMKDEAAIR